MIRMCKIGNLERLKSWISEDMIMGGAKRSNDSLTHADALQSVFLVASPQDVYLRFKDKVGRKMD